MMTEKTSTPTGSKLCASQYICHAEAEDGGDRCLTDDVLRDNDAGLVALPR